MEPLWIFGTLVSIIMAAVGFLVKLVYKKIEHLEGKVNEMEKSLVRVVTIIDEFERK